MRVVYLTTDVELYSLKGIVKTASIRTPSSSRSDRGHLELTLEEKLDKESNNPLIFLAPDAFRIESGEEVVLYSTNQFEERHNESNSRIRYIVALQVLDSNGLSKTNVLFSPDVTYKR